MNTAIAHAQQITSIHTLRRSELPVSCPRVGESLSHLHPRVYLSFNKDGFALCPYCGTRYQLKD